MFARRVSILPRMLVELRADEVEQKMLPWNERLAEQTVGRVLGNEKLLVWGIGVLRAAQSLAARGGELKLPFRNEALRKRKIPGLAPRSFREMWASGELEDIE